MNQNATHNGMGSLLEHHFHRAEQMEAAVRSRKLSVVNDTLSSSRWSDIGGHSVPLGARNNRSPVLESLRKSVVRSLVHDDAVHNMELVAVFGGDGLQGVLREHLATNKPTEQFHPPRRAIVVLLHLFRCGLGHNMAISGSAQESDGGVLVGRAEAVDDGVTGNGQLDVESAVEVGIVSNRSGSIILEGAQPVGNQRRVIQKIRTSEFRHLRVEGLHILITLVRESH
mmetsp:Transcript_23388/g.65701  ORF Transcript_23388/g.65701 Transcript_23388/m.65701 type:complete len:227 (-) Transcript_23388:1411-2091(-)